MKEKRLVTVIGSKTGKPLVRDKQQRNQLCDCGSGKKCKKCCGATHKYYDTGAVKAAYEKAEKEKQEARELVETLRKPDIK